MPPPKAGEDGSLSDMFSDAAENFLDFKDDPFFDADDSESELKSQGQDKEDPYAEPELGLVNNIFFTSTFSI